MRRRPPPRTFTVLDKTEITPHMLRLTLGGEGMSDFPIDQSSAYVKLRFVQADSDKPLLRTYTIRTQRPESIDVDFVRHGDTGLAARWAENVTPGETIDIGGPGPRKLVDPTADWCVLIGDMSALPAIAANIELLPAAARGYIVIEVTAGDDIQELSVPENMAIRWVINPQSGVDSEPLHQAVAALDWLPGTPSAWCACEFNTMLRLRKHLRSERGLTRHELYVSSYWQHGQTEDKHKVNKRVDNEADQMVAC